MKLADISTMKVSLISRPKLPYCKCGKLLSRRENVRCKPCFAKERKGKFVKMEVKYYGVHRWIRITFGSANKCEKPDCKLLSTSFEWSLIKGKKYERIRENFWQLCKQCHNVYDNVYENRKRNKYGIFISN